MGVCITVIAYEAASTIVDVLDRIPTSIGGVAPTILISDDASTDDTAAIARRWADGSVLDVTVLVQPVNLGYGGNQKVVYRTAIDRGEKVVVLVHGDGQYPPERCGDLAGPILEGRADAVYGSRLLTAGGARAGRMPLIRLAANRVLSTFLNVSSGTPMSEWFSGFRAYRTDVLESVGFEDLPDGFDFDSKITLDLLGQGRRLQEVAMPTFYGDEISRVPLVRTGLMALAHGGRHLVRRVTRRV